MNAGAHGEQGQQGCAFQFVRRMQSLVRNNVDTKKGWNCTRVFPSCRHGGQGDAHEVLVVCAYRMHIHLSTPLFLALTINGQRYDGPDIPWTQIHLGQNGCLHSCACNKFQASAELVSLMKDQQYCALHI
jgi:hypothetical protein